jgi:hypothetical protein
MIWLIFSASSELPATTQIKFSSPLLALGGGKVGVLYLCSRLRPAGIIFYSFTLTPRNDQSVSP